MDTPLPFSCFFAGDTGYAYSPDDNVGKVVCPAFKQIGDIYNGFDLALLPIGSVPYVSVVLLLLVSFSPSQRISAAEISL